MVRSFGAIHPAISRTAFIAETAVVIGDVQIGDDSSIWYNVVVRGDVNSIRIGSRTNVQDLAVLHVTGRKSAAGQGGALIIGNDVTIGHGVTMHGCTVDDGAFIGMNAIVMDRCVIGKGAMIAAGSLVPEGTVIPPHTLWMGSPARYRRNLTEKESARITATTASYVRLAADYRQPALPSPADDLPYTV